MFKSKKVSVVIAGAILMTTIGATSAIAQGKCGANKCGAANTIIQGNLKKIETQMNHLKKLKREVIRANNMKCGAAKEEAAKRADEAMDSEED